MEVLDANAEHSFEIPAKKIHDEHDLAFFLSSQAYSDIMTFLVQLNTAMVPRKLAGSAPTDSATTSASASASAPAPAPAPAAPSTTTSALKLPPPRRAKPPIQIWEINSPDIPFSPAVASLGALISNLDALIAEAPPDPGPRRFGNISFRKWFSLVERQSSTLLEKYLPSSQLLVQQEARDELQSYFLGSFGSAARLDYGTGHELSFLAFLGAVWRLGGFAQSENRDGAEERGIVVGVIVPYLQLMRRLIGTYTLEPAGSHGVWGLDDHFFLPYIFGSAQYAPAIAAGEPAPLEGSRPGAPRPDDVIKPAVVERERTVNLYFGAIGFVYDVKRGPFWEHSPQLYDISGVKDGWGKINKGLMKMYVGEVLSKFPVVQHFPFGSLFRWERDANVPTVPASALAPSPARSASGSAVTGGPSAMQPAVTGTAMPNSGAGGGTAAPWAISTHGSTTLRTLPTTPSLMNSSRMLPRTTPQLHGREALRRGEHEPHTMPPPTRHPPH